MSMSDKNIRVRNNATVKEILLDKDKYENVQKLLNRKQVWKLKEKLIAAVGFKACFCCVCDKITSPLYEVRYSDTEVVRLEIYCSTHIESVYQKTKDSTSEELAAKYNCQIGEVPHTIPNPWD